MTESKERAPENLSLITKLLKESGHEILGISQKSTLKIVGESGHNVQEYVANTNKGELAFFLKVFKDLPIEIGQDEVRKELRATQKLNSLTPGLTYSIIAHSIETPSIITRTISDSITLDAYFKGVPNKADATFIDNCIGLIAYVHKNGVVHGDALPRNFSYISSRQFEDDKFNGLVILDFEKAEFEEDLTKEKFEELKKEDLARFLCYLFPIILDEEARPNWKQELQNYYNEQNDVIMNSLKKHYGEGYANEMRKQIENYVNDVINPQ